MTSGPSDVEGARGGAALEGMAGGCVPGVVVGDVEGAADDDDCVEASGACDGEGVDCAAEEWVGAGGNDGSVGTAAEVDGLTTDEGAAGTLDTGAGSGTGATGEFDGCGGGEGVASEDCATVVYWVMTITGGGVKGVGES
jgi:hypothetical protein